MLEIQDILRGVSLAPDKSAPAKPKEEPKAPAVPVIPKPKRVTAPPLPLPAEIFRAYDIRGIVDQSLSDETVGLIAQAIGTEAVSLGHHAIIVCRDGRLSGPRLLNILIDGLKSTGLSVINIGAVPTPVMYFSTYALGTRAGVALTGSHNPKDYNGLKITLGGKSIAGEGIQKIRRIAESRNFAIGNGKVREQNMIPEYLDRIIEDVTLMRPMKIVVDCGNGVAAAVAPKLFQALGCTVEVYGGEIDGNFPNHHPDPSVPANYEALINLVKIHQADLGIAFDGDGDRLGVVDSEGRIIWPDRLMMLFARDVLSRNPGKEIIYDVKCTQRLSKVISEYGGIPVMWKTGHSWIKNKMQELDAPLAGEMSGHIFFSERWYGFDDALYAASRLLEILSADDRTSTEIFDELPDGISTPELKTDLKEGEPHKMIEEFLTRARFPAAKITSIDGLRADYVDGWGLARASNTTPSLVFRFDADNEAALSRIQQEFRRQILAINPKLKLPF
jgi:phosphomannomutase/phosphoglucomutase